MLPRVSARSPASAAARHCGGLAHAAHASSLIARVAHGAAASPAASVLLLLVPPVPARHLSSSPRGALPSNFPARPALLRGTRAAASPLARGAQRRQFISFDFLSKAGRFSSPASGGMETPGPVDAARLRRLEATANREPANVSAQLSYLHALAR